MHKIGKNALWLSISKIITLCIGIITSMLLVRFQSLTEYGTLSQILTIVGLAVAIFTVGLPNSINYFLPNCTTQEEKDKFLSLFYILNTLIAIVLGLLLIVSVPLFTWYYSNQALGKYWFVLAILPWTSVIIGSRSNMMIAENKIKREIVLNILNCFSLLFIIIISMLFKQSFQIYIILYVLVQVIHSVLVYRESLMIIRKVRWKVNKELLKELLKFAIPMGVAAAVSTITLDMDKLMIGWFLDTKSFAIYTVAGKELPITFIASSFTAILLPQIVSGIKMKQVKETVSLWGTTVELNFIILSFFVTACIVFAPQIITFLYSDKYLEGIQVFRIYSIVILFRVTYFGMFLNAYGRSKLIMVFSFLSLLTNAILNIVCYLLFGFVGPAIASLASIVVIQMAQLVASSRLLKIPLKHIFPWKKMLLAIIINLAIGANIYLIIQKVKLGTSYGDIAIAIGIGVVWTGIYFCIYISRLKKLWSTLNNV